MAILRQFRDEAVRRVYHQGAVAYLVLALVVLALTNLLPPLAAAAGPATPRWQSIGATIFFIVVASIVVWRGHRTLTILLLVLCLVQALGHLITATGLRVSFQLETARPENLASLAAWQAFIKAELATPSPFYNSVTVASKTPFALYNSLHSLPLIGRAVPAGGPQVQPAVILYVCAALMFLAALFLWRAAAKHPR